MTYEKLKERHMFKGFWYILIGIYISANAGVKIIPPEADHPATFAIIIDSVTFSIIEDLFNNIKGLYASTIPSKMLF